MACWIPTSKFLDTTINNPIDSTTSVVLINGCTRGPDSVSRLGRQIRMRKIEMRYQGYATAGTGTDQIHRIVVVYDKQANGVAAAYSDVFGGSTSVHYPISMSTASRFEILYDYRVAVNAAGEPGTNYATQFCERMDHMVTFNSGSLGTIADINTGALYVMLSGTNAAGASAGTVQGRVRVYFEDF